MQVRVDNDCVMLALAEKWQHQGTQQDFCVINVDYGIGSSFVINDIFIAAVCTAAGRLGIRLSILTAKPATAEDTVASKPSPLSAR